MDGRTSQHSPTALPAGDALEDTRLHAGASHDVPQHGKPPRARKTGYVLLLAAEALPPAFLAETDEDALIYTEPGDQQVRQAVQELRLAVTRYNMCWCSAPERIACDLYRVFVAPAPELLHTTQALPLFFSDEELEAALRVTPSPRRSLRPTSLSAQAAPPGAVPDPPAEQSASPASASAQPTPLAVGTPERVEVYASLKTIAWAFSTIELPADKRRLPFRLRQLWLLRAALQAVHLDQQRLADQAGVADTLRRVLVRRRQAPPGRIKIEPYYEDGQLVGCELSVVVPPELERVA
jgi:hypothetical protein